MGGLVGVDLAGREAGEESLEGLAELLVDNR